jgi:sugar/nucleoside kinase (ribokinase family)
MSLVIVGTVAFDAIETPFGKTDKIVGGAATFISIAASYFNKTNKLISVIGDDYDMQMLERLKKKGIDLEGLQIKKGEKSFFWSGKYHYDLNSRDTMNFWMDIALEPLKEVIKHVDVITINDEEARQLSGEYSLVKAARKILTMGPKYVVIKKGEHGALLFDKEHMFFAPAMPLEEVMDPTGAGDTFAGGFIGYLAHTNDISFENMKRAIIIGSALASFTVEKFGTERIINITDSEIDNRIHSFVNLVDFNIEFVE